MPAHLKIMNLRLALPLLSSFALLGCASSQQRGEDIPDWDWGNSEIQQGDRASLTTHSGESGAVIFSPGVEAQGSWYAYEREYAPEFNRRDSELSVRIPDATAGWYAWPEQQRPSLDDRGYFRTSNNPETYVFPGSDRPVYGRPHYGGSYHHYRRDTGRGSDWRGNDRRRHVR
ncbi:MAG: hypothetical protein R3B67_10350 [Phycisphaerales bacterium]